MNKAVYAGSFDPITVGHMWMIAECSMLCHPADIVVAIGENPDKTCTFSLEERIRFIEETFEGYPNVCVKSFQNQFLVNFAESIGASHIVRGIRDTRDYEFERGMRHINNDLNPNISTIFLMPPRDVAEVSSSLVKGMIGPEGWHEVVKKYVPEVVYEAILEKYA